MLPALSSPPPPPPPPTRSFCSSTVPDLSCLCGPSRSLAVALVLFPLIFTLSSPLVAIICTIHPSSSPCSTRPFDRSNPSTSFSHLRQSWLAFVLARFRLGSLSSCSLWCLDHFESHPSIRASSSRIPYIFRTSSLHVPHRNSHSSSVAGHLYRAAVVLSRLYPKACRFNPLSPLSAHTPSSTPPLQGYSHLASIIPCRLTPWRASLPSIPSLQLPISSPSSSLATTHISTSPSARTFCITLQTISPKDSIFHQYHRPALATL